MANSSSVRKAIARVLTVIHLKQRQNLREFYKKKRHQPLDLRTKKTRALRKRLTKVRLTFTLLLAEWEVDDGAIARTTVGDGEGEEAKAGFPDAQIRHQGLSARIARSRDDALRKGEEEGRRRLVSESKESQCERNFDEREDVWDFFSTCCLRVESRACPAHGLMMALLHGICRFGVPVRA